jgi:hypothetical protein
MLRMIALGLVGILFMLNWLTLLVLGVTSRAGTAKERLCFQIKMHFCLESLIQIRELTPEAFKKFKCELIFM